MMPTKCPGMKDSGGDEVKYITSLSVVINKNTDLTVTVLITEFHHINNNAKSVSVHKYKVHCS